MAEAAGRNDEDKIARTVITLRRTAWLTGGLGLLVMVVFCVPLSRMTFDPSEYAWPIALSGIILLSSAIAAGQGCIINGTRRIADQYSLFLPVGSSRGSTESDSFVFCDLDYVLVVCSAGAG